MKKRNIIAVLCALVCVGLCQQVQAAPAPETPDPGSVVGLFNTADGDRALQAATGASIGNSAFGAFSLFSTTTGIFNTAVGAGALDLNTADENTAVGAAALFLNTTGGTLETVGGFDVGPNTAVGTSALLNNIDASASTAVGFNALSSQQHGISGIVGPQLAGNTAVGFEALANVTGAAAGDNAGNDGYGYKALFDLTDGDSNVAMGFESGAGLTSGSGNIYIGAFQFAGAATEFFHTYIGNISGTSLPFGGTVDLVTIDLSTGLLGHNSSSRRYKEDIKPMDKTSEALYRLKPVTYRIKKEINSARPACFGLIAEEVAEVNPDLIVRNGQGQVEGVHYEMVNAMLLNEFLKEHKKVEEQQAGISQLKSEMQTMVAQLKEQAAQIQKVSAQLEMSKPAAKVVVDKR
jgi:Chaperone of endosialidase